MERRTKATSRSLEDPGGADSRSDGKSKTRRSSGMSKAKLFCSLLLLLVLGVSLHLSYVIYFTDDVIDAAMKKVAPPREMTGGLSADKSESLTNADRLFPKLWRGPECVDFDEDGVMYTSTMSGEIWKLVPGNDQPVLVTRTGKEICDFNLTLPEPRCGRPLGFRLMSDNTLLVADAYAGLLRVSLSDGIVTTLVPYGKSYGGHPLLFPNDLAIGPDGIVYMSDASHRFPLHKLFYDVLEARPNGRILRYNPNTDVTDVFADDLYFANGVELSHDRASILVAETNYFRVTRLFIDERAGKREVVIDGLPGFPDNIRRHPDGGYLVGIPNKRAHAGEFGNERPALRNAMAKLLPYEEFGKAAANYGLCIHISEDGRVVNSWHDPRAETLSHAAHCYIHGESLYVGSFIHAGLGRLKLTTSAQTHTGRD